MNDILASVPHRERWPGNAVRQAEMSPRRCSPAAPRGIIATWKERIRFRWNLSQMAKDNPHLIDDIGLTKRQVEAEIAKPFWRA